MAAVQRPGITTRNPRTPVQAYRDGFDDGVECGERQAAVMWRAWWLVVGMIAGVVIGYLARHV